MKITEKRSTTYWVNLRDCSAYGFETKKEAKKFAKKRDDVKSVKRSRFHQRSLVR